jgi:hypothetical protein
MYICMCTCILEILLRNGGRGVQKNFDANVLRDIFILRETACDTVCERYRACVYACMYV